MYGASKFYIGGDHTGATDNGRMKPITGIRFMLDDETEIFAGDESGTVLTQTCPYATQAMADAALQRLKGYEYQMASVEAAGLDPAAEPGDGITAGGVYFPLSRVSDDGEGFPNVEAPGETELEDEYPTHGDGPLTQYLKQKITGAYTSIEKTRDDITLKVQGVDDRVTTVVEDLDGVHTSIRGLDGKITTVETTVNGITVTGEGGTTYIKPGAIQAESITGSMIAASTIEAGNLAADCVTATQIKAGSVGTNELNSDSLNIGNGKFVLSGNSLTIKNCNITLQNSAVQSNMLQNDAVTEDKILNGAVTADKINARGLSIGPTGGEPQFSVDANGNVTIGGSVTFKSGVIQWEDIGGTSGLVSDLSTAKNAAQTATDDVKSLASGNYTKAGTSTTTFISGKIISSATIRGGTFQNTDGTGQFKVTTASSVVSFGIGLSESNPTISFTADTSSSGWMSSIKIPNFSVTTIGEITGGITICGTKMLSYTNLSGPTFTAGGSVWDFSGVTVRGIDSSWTSGVSYLTSAYSEFYLVVVFAGTTVRTPVYAVSRNDTICAACGDLLGNGIYNLEINISSTGAVSVSNIYRINADTKDTYNLTRFTVYAR